MNTENSGTVQQVVPRQVLLSAPSQQRPEVKQTNPLTRAIVHGKYASPEVVAARIEICRQCDRHRITSGGVDWCEVSNCKVSREDRRIDNLAAYEENLPKWGCMHPSRGQGRGWSLLFPVDSKAAAAIFPQYGSRAAVPTVNSATPKSSANNSSPVLRKQVQLLFNAADKPVDLENTYRGRSCFLICGGPSFGKLNHSKLRQSGILTMAVNNAAKTFRPNLWTCVDNPDHFLRSIWLDPAILKLVPMDVRNVHVFNSDAWAYLDKTVADCPNTFFYKRQLDFDAARFLTADTCCWGSNNHDGRVKSVMFAAIRLLHYLGIRRIFLLGCDFKMATRQAYHFEQQRAADLAVRINNDYNVLQQRFKQLRPIFEAAGLRVYNCNPKSKLDVFEKISFDRAVAMSLEEWGNINVATERTTGLYDRPKPEPPEPHPPRNHFWHNKPIIPPIAHFVWLGSPLPKMASDFIERFRRLNPGLKVRLWTRIPADMPSDLQEAAKRVPQLCQQSDLVRLWVLSKYGGIYLDTDTYCLRSMEELRHYENFIAKGNDGRLVNAVIGFARSSQVLRSLLKEARLLTPEVGCRMLRTLFGPKLFTEFHLKHPDQLNVLPTHYFYVIHSHETALRAINSGPENQKHMIGALRERMTDRVSPFAIHIWGFPPDAMPHQTGRSSFAQTQPPRKTVNACGSKTGLDLRHVHWKWGDNLSMASLYNVGSRLENDLIKLEGAWKDDTVVIWGNGYTVRMALRLRTESWFTKAKHIGTNMAMKLGIPFSAYCIGDARFVERPEKADVARNATGVKVYQSVLRPILGDELSVSYVTTIGREGFCSDLRRGIYHGYSVVWLALQVAVWTNAKDILLAGCPYDYSVHNRFYDETKPSPVDNNIPRILSNYRRLLQRVNDSGILIRVIGESRLCELGIDRVDANGG